MVSLLACKSYLINTEGVKEKDPTFNHRLDLECKNEIQAFVKCRNEINAKNAQASTPTQQ